MRERHMRNRLDLFHFEYPKVRLPLVESIQRVIVRAEVFRQTVPTDSSLEHTIQRRSMNCAVVDTETDDATCELVHHYEDPMGSQRRHVSRPVAPRRRRSTMRPRQVCPSPASSKRQKT